MATIAPRTVGPVRLEVIEAGVGGRPLLLTHGFTGVKEDFGDWIDAFADEGWWVVAPDLRGHGDSDHPEREDLYSLALFAQDLLGLADELGWARFSLLGHSMGGMIAQEVALAAPDRIERLVLMDTNHGPVDGLDADTVAFGVEVLRTSGIAGLVEVLSQLPQQPKAPSDVRVRAEREGYAEFADGKVHRCSPAMYAAMGVELTTRADRLAELAGLTMPVRVVVGAEDTGFLPASRRIADAIASADLVVIPDAAHCPQFENPEAWWQAVAPFLKADQLVD
ncbi:MAG: putative hydrolase or acyltransferase of alpha/beta superfamily [Ilumatobacteraceae bacterium]|nr:putative hydrolase or acyltransferase of alpha/beta superfamily [Ilumatobacteraceae bacterium]